MSKKLDQLKEFLLEAMKINGVEIIRTEVTPADEEGHPADVHYIYCETGGQQFLMALTDTKE